MANAEVLQLLGNPRVYEIIEDSRLHAREGTYRLTMPWEHGCAQIKREGQYPLHTDQGTFQATLLRVLPDTQAGEQFRGGEFRVIANAHVQDHLYDSTIRPLIMLDVIPLFLKELADPRAQHALALAREEIQRYPGPAFLVQKKASDIHDREERLKKMGQQDIEEEVWWGKMLNVMKALPGVDMNAAANILIRLGDKAYLQDYGLGASSVLAYYYAGHQPETYEQVTIDGSSYLRPFERKFIEEDALKPQILDQVRLKSMLAEAVNPRVRVVEVDGQHIEVRNIIKYPIRQNGVILTVQLISTKRSGQRGFQTFRVVSYGDQKDAYFRADSICTNGVQGGDNHCDCLAQTQNELRRAEHGIPMCIINLRDDEGRGHGEARKGATLAVQRRMEKELGISLGNGSAATLFYAGTKEPVDARQYDTLMAVIDYLGMKRIAHLVTNNHDKIQAISTVADIGEVVTAEVLDGLTQEAQKTLREKANGDLGVKYTY